MSNIIDNRRLSKEIKLNGVSDKFKISYGTTNRIEPNVVYLKFNAWCEYVGDFKEYINNIEEFIVFLKYNIKKNVFNEYNIFTNDFIFNIDYAKTIKINKPFHFNLEITLKQKNTEKDIKLLKEEMERISTDTLSLLEANDNFNFFLKK